ncbi:MAG: hypothetical protein ACI4OA_00565 [Selenomonadaceae bacterium]
MKIGNIEDLLKWDPEEEKRVLRQEALERAHAEDVRAVMKSLNCTKEKAMELLKIPADLEPKILAML